MKIAFTFFFTGALLLAASVAAADTLPTDTLPADARTTGSRPNILFILADDFGWGDASCNNPDAAFSTPNIDRLAEGGIRFTNAHVPHSVCSPTRYSLLTGRYAWRTRLREGVLSAYDNALIPPTRLTVASLLQNNGYHTGVFGKWHLGMNWQPIEGDPGDWHWGSQVRAKAVGGMISQRVDHTRPILGGPMEIGFDTCFVTPTNNSRFQVFVRDDRIEGTLESGALNRSSTGMLRDPRVKQNVVDDYFVKEAIAFLDDHVSKQKEKPFFLYLPLNAAHATTKAPERFRKKTKDGKRGDRCLWVNESVGKILDALESRSLSEDTLVLFSADNGPISPHRYNADTPHRAAGPYRGYKTDAWDGGFRVPFLARWPGRIPAGATYDGLFCLSDVFATLAALVGEDIPHWSGEDSANQLPALLGQSVDGPLRESMITQSYVGVLSMRQGKWKLILDTKGSGGHEHVTPEFQPLVMGPPWEIRNSCIGQLYDIETDPYEQNDLFDEHPEVVAKIKTKLQKHIYAGRSRP